MLRSSGPLGVEPRSPPSVTLKNFNPRPVHFIARETVHGYGGAARGTRPRGVQAHGDRLRRRGRRHPRGDQGEDRAGRRRALQEQDDRRGCRDREEDASTSGGDGRGHPPDDRRVVARVHADHEGHRGHRRQPQGNHRRLRARPRQPDGAARDHQEKQRSCRGAPRPEGGDGAHPRARRVRRRVPGQVPRGHPGEDMGRAGRARVRRSRTKIRRGAGRHDRGGGFGAAAPHPRRDGQEIPRVQAATRGDGLDEGADRACRAESAGVPKGVAQDNRVGARRRRRRRGIGFGPGSGAVPADAPRVDPRHPEAVRRRRRRGPRRWGVGEGLGGARASRSGSRGVFPRERRSQRRTLGSERRGWTHVRAAGRIARRGRVAGAVRGPRGPEARDRAVAY